jgi:hypothetical protein
MCEDSAMKKRATKSPAPTTPLSRQDLAKVTGGLEPTGIELPDLKFTLGAGPDGQ